jgi:hypothetical protein
VLLIRSGGRDHALECPGLSSTRRRSPAECRSRTGCATASSQAPQRTDLLLLLVVQRHCSCRSSEGRPREDFDSIEDVISEFLRKWITVCAPRSPRRIDMKLVHEVDGVCPWLDRPRQSWVSLPWRERPNPSKRFWNTSVERISSICTSTGERRARTYARHRRASIDGPEARSVSRYGWLSSMAFRSAD